MPAPGQNDIVKPKWGLAVVTLGLLAGCTMSPLYQLERPGLERSLPAGVAMSDYVDKDWVGKVTVAEKLARLGAYTEGDRVIRDGAGKEIRFFKHSEGGKNAGPELQRQRDELRDLKKRFTVIEITRDPDLTPPADTSPPKSAHN